MKAATLPLHVTPAATAVRAPASAQRTHEATSPDPPAGHVKSRPPLPGWPRGMPEWMAAGYVGLSATLLRQQDIKRTWLTPGRMVYLKEHLDAWLDAKDGRVPVAADAEFDWDSGFANMRAAEDGKRHSGGAAGHDASSLDGNEWIRSLDAKR